MFIPRLLTVVALLHALCTVSIAEPIRIALVGPMHGVSESTGAQLRAGAVKAAEMINETGGVLGRPLVVAVFNDGCDNRQAVAQANEVVNRGMVAVVGHHCSATSIVASTIYAEEGVVMISPGSTSPVLTERGLDNVFRTIGRDDTQGKVAAAYIASNTTRARIGLLHNSTIYGKGLALETRRALKEDWEITDTELWEFAPGQQDFTEIVDELLAAEVGFIYAGANGLEVAALKRELSRRDIETPVMGGDAVSALNYWESAGELAAGTLVTFGPDVFQLPSAQPVLERFREDDFEPMGFTLNSYAAVEVLAQALAQTGRVNIERMLEILREETFDTVLGPIAFDDKGDRIGSTFMVYRLLQEPGTMQLIFDPNAPVLE